MLKEELSEKLALTQKLNERLDSDFPFYAKHNLLIKTENGGLEPFSLNFAQAQLHAFVEKQRAETGKVRILIPKARQEGCSTYIAGRFYHKTTRFKGKATFILSHLSDTTEKLYQMIERFHKYCPEPVKATTNVANRRRMVFDGLESEYFVGTAGTDSIGRGGTIQHLHGSECAYYPESSDFSKGILQSVPDLPGTEVFLESTANGMDPLFYEMCMAALEGRSEYRIFFIPWFWKPSYRRDVPIDFEIEESERRIAELYNLNLRQIYWRRCKIATDFKGDLKSFQQEYPACIEEAFVSSGESLISSFKVQEARKSTIIDDLAPLIIAADANEADGRSGIAFRRGRRLEKVYAIEGRKPMELVGMFAELMDTCQPVKFFIDTGNGYGIIDRLIELGYGDMVMGVSFNDGTFEQDVYLNKRVEMAFAFKFWIENGGVRIPDDDRLHKEITAIPEAQKTSSGLKKLEPKEKIMKDKKLKLDLFDACIMTFAFPVRVESWQNRKKPRLVNTTKSKIKSIQRRNGLDNNRSNVASGKIQWPS